MKLPFARLFPRNRWVSQDGISKREYASYRDYVIHQKAKLPKIHNLGKKREVLKAALRERLPHIPEIARGRSVLCLGARRGAECEAFIERGAFAIGIDLNPGVDNCLVVVGDFHNLQYADHSVDCVYTNSLDHVFDLDRVLGEIRRVLKLDGIFIAEIVRGSRDSNGRNPGKYASCWWNRSDDLLDVIADSGFEPESKADFVEPWNGIQVVFRIVAT